MKKWRPKRWDDGRVYIFLGNVIWSYQMRHQIDFVESGWRIRNGRGFAGTETCLRLPLRTDLGIASWFVSRLQNCSPDRIPKDAKFGAASVPSLCLVLSLKKVVFGGRKSNRSRDLISFPMPFFQCIIVEWFLLEDHWVLRIVINSMYFTANYRHKYRVNTNSM